MLAEPVAAPRGVQRVLFAVAAALLALSLFAAARTASRRSVRAVADEPALEVRIDLNAASAAQLEALPGVGPVLAAKIVAHREGRGAFRRTEELAQVGGIGAALAGRLQPLVTVAGQQ